MLPTIFYQQTMNDWIEGRINVWNYSEMRYISYTKLNNMIRTIHMNALAIYTDADDIVTLLSLSSMIFIINN